MGDPSMVYNSSILPESTYQVGTEVVWQIWHIANDFWVNPREIVFIRPADGKHTFIGLRNGEKLIVPIQVSGVMKKLEKFLTKK